MYQIDTASFMLITNSWIPIEGVYEADLIQALTEQRRRFVKPLRDDAHSAAAFPDVLLLDTGAKPTPLHLLSAAMDAKERAAKARAAKAQGEPPGRGSRTNRYHRCRTLRQPGRSRRACKPSPLPGNQ